MMAAKKIKVKYKKLDNKKDFKKARNIFNKLKTDPASVVFAEESLNVTILGKIFGTK